MKKLAIIGVTGLVGQSLLRVLEEEGLTEAFDLFMFVSDKSAGKILQYNNKHYFLNELNKQIFDIKLDYAVFLTSENVSRVWAKNLSVSGVTVIDNSCAFRLDKDVPLIVPEINFNKINLNDKLIANPNCSTIQLVLVLNLLKSLTKIKKVVVSSYQSVSGAGKDAILDLENDTRDIFPVSMRENVVASIGAIDEQGACAEENKIVHETKKILDCDFDIFATCVRVPIKYCHGESVYIEFEESVSCYDVKRRLMDNSYIKVSDELFYPSECAGTDITYVCRLRQAGENGIQMFIIADNLRRGASYNAVKILDMLLVNNKT